MSSTRNRRLTVKDPFFLLDQATQFLRKHLGNSAVLLKAIAAKAPRFYLRDYAGMNRTTAKDYRRQITQQQIETYLPTKTGQETKIASLGLV